MNTTIIENIIGRTITSLGMAQMNDNLTLESYKKIMNIVKLSFMKIQYDQNFSYQLCYFKKLIVEFLNVFKYVNNPNFMDIQKDIEKNIEVLYICCSDFKEDILLEMSNLNERTKEIAEDTIVLIDLVKDMSRDLWRKKMEVFQKTNLNDDVLTLISSFSTRIM
jgi:hypothetical protein